MATVPAALDVFGKRSVPFLGDAVDRANSAAFGVTNALGVPKMVPKLSKLRLPWISKKGTHGPSAGLPKAAHQASQVDSLAGAAKAPLDDGVRVGAASRGDPPPSLPKQTRRFFETPAGQHTIKSANTVAKVGIIGGGAVAVAPWAGEQFTKFADRAAPGAQRVTDTITNTIEKFLESVLGGLGKGGKELGQNVAEGLLFPAVVVGGFILALTLAKRPAPRGASR